MKTAREIALLLTFFDAVQASAAPVPSPFSVQVFQPDASNVVFVVSNTSTGSIWLPTNNYADFGFYEPVTTNDWVHYRTAHIGLWLTDDWRYMGTNWWFMSTEECLAQLAPTQIKTGQSISVRRRLSPLESRILSSGAATTRFTLQVSPESAGRYGLSSGEAATTNVNRMNQSQQRGGTAR